MHYCSYLERPLASWANSNAPIFERFKTSSLIQEKVAHQIKVFDKKLSHKLGFDKKPDIAANSFRISGAEESIQVFIPRKLFAEIWHHWRLVD